MINLPTKVLIGLGVAGAIGGGGYGIYSVASRAPLKTIAQVLAEKGKKLLPFDESNNTAWDTKVNAFPSGDSSSLGDFKKKSGTDKASENREAMKKECQKLSSISFSKEKEDIKAQVEKWCTDSSDG